MQLTSRESVTNLTSSASIFGTDGVRGLANTGLITAENVMKLATFVVAYYASKDHKSAHDKFTVVIGKDTRLSGYMLESALTAGFIAAGADVFLLGPLPTPGVALMTRSFRADLGVMVSASHNPYHDNGIKFFCASGFKISPEDEIKISEMFRVGNAEFATVERMGKARRLDDARGRYVEFAKNSFPKSLDLIGLKVVVDAANGAAYRIAPQVFWELGADVIEIGNEPDGLNINKNCGATDIGTLRKIVCENGADIGIALDGDGDRIAIVDEAGVALDGDNIIAGIATDWRESGRLGNNKIVTTHMSNTGFGEYLDGLGLELVRTDVGDKYVIEKMLETGAQLGGEKSGHIIPIEYASTGDGLISALQILAYMRRKSVSASAIRNLYEPHLQVFKNISGLCNLDKTAIHDIVKRVENETLNGCGRVILRKSGTENVMRIMVEAAGHREAELAIAEIEKVVTCQD